MIPKNIKKILLISPPNRSPASSPRACMPPLGILYIAAVLRNAGYDIHVIDAHIEDYNHKEPDNGEMVFYGLSFQKIENRIRGLMPDAIGISCLFSPSFLSVQKICNIAKMINRNIVTVTGGTHPSFLAKQCLESTPTLDYIVIGEGEETTKKLFDRLNDGKDITDIGGLAYRKEEMVRINKKESFIQDLDGLPLPARDLVPIKKYRTVPALISTGKSGTSVITSRGCPFECVFCSSSVYWGNQYRERSAEAVLEEICMLVKERGMREIQFIDDNLTLNRERAVKIFQGIIDRHLNIDWSVPNGLAPQTIDEEMAKLMKRSGCSVVAIAIESGDQDVLSRIMHKPFMLDSVRKSVEAIKKAGIKAHGLFMIGSPEETPEQIRKTFALAEELDLDSCSFSIAQPLPGTKLAEMVKKRIKNDIDYENTSFQHADYATGHFTSAELERMALKECFRLHLLLLYKHPGRFAKRFGPYILRKPGHALGLIAKVLKNAVWGSNRPNYLVRRYK